MRRSLAALVALLIVGCESVSAPKAGPNPVHSAAELHCSLPVITSTHVGFVDFPSGLFRSDPSAPTDYLFGLTYAFGAHRWVKTFYAFGFQLLSPDGKELAKVVPGAQGLPALDLVNVAKNTTRHVGNIPAARILGFLPDGLYVANAFVYRVDLTSGKVTEIGPKASDAQSVSQGSWFWVTSSAAWFSLAALPNQGDRNSVLSTSLSDGKLQTWYTAPSQRSVSIVGFVAPDRPLIVEYDTEPPGPMAGVSFMLLTAPGVMQPLGFDPSISAWGVTDSTGVWLESPGHVWLYDKSGLIPMADLSATPGSEIIRVAGPCR